MNIQDLTLKDLSEIADLIFKKVLENELFQRAGYLLDAILEFDFINTERKIDLSFIISGSFLGLHYGIRKSEIKSIESSIMSIEINSEDNSVSLSNSQIKYIENQF